MTDNFDTGHSTRAEAFAGTSAVMDPVAVPTVLVFNDVASLVESLRPPESELPIEREQPTTVRGASPMARPTAVAVNSGYAVPDQAADPAPAPTVARTPSPPAAPPGPPPAPEASTQTDPVDVITDEERTRYGLLLDSAAERGLLDPADYEIRLRELAEATTTAQMTDIVAELPAFAGGSAGPAATRSRRSIQSANRADRPAGQRRRLIMWAVMGLLVVVALVSLVILALSAERLSRSRNSSLPPTPVATRPVSALRL